VSVRISLVVLVACATPTPPPLAPGHYRDPSAWLCLPGRSDPCGLDISTTEIRPDGTRAPRAMASQQPADCFYVYPTVDLGLRPGNHEDFADLSKIAETTRAQVARFAQVCTLYVPLYRQARIGSYLRGGHQLDANLDAAYADVADAFRHYLATYNRGRDLVLIGHSQGAEMVKRLVVDVVERDPALRARLLVALPIGGRFDTSTFQLPACSATAQRGCVIAYRSYLDGTQPEDASALCVNPGRLLDPEMPGPLDATYLNSGHLDGVAGVTTPFISFPALYSARCVAGVLVIAETPGRRTSPVRLDRLVFETSFGTHVIDLQIAQDTLIEIVRRAEQARSP
jgi:hypothetical protein